jgi:hypothetical protein
MQIDIQGSAEFVRQTKTALGILEQRDPTNYERAIRTVRKIAPGYKGATVNIDSKTIYLPQDRFSQDPEGIAGEITHETAHLVVAEKIPTTTNGLDGFVERGARNEKICLKTELRCLKRISPGHPEIQRLFEIINNPELLAAHIVGNALTRLNQMQIPKNNRAQIEQRLRKQEREYARAHVADFRKQLARERAKEAEIKKANSWRKRLLDKMRSFKK